MISILGDKEAMRSLGVRIRDERLRRNFSQAYVAGVVGVTLPTYRKIEAGDGSIEFRHVVKTLGLLGYAEALGKLIPDVQPEITLEQLMKATTRKRASRTRAQR